MRLPGKGIGTGLAGQSRAVIVSPACERIKKEPLFISLLTLMTKWMKVPPPAREAGEARLRECERCPLDSGWFQLRLVRICPESLRDSRSCHPAPSRPSRAVRFPVRRRKSRHSSHESPLRHPCDEANHREVVGYSFSLLLAAASGPCAFAFSP